MKTKEPFKSINCEYILFVTIGYHVCHTLLAFPHSTRPDYADKRAGM